MNQNLSIVFSIFLLAGILVPVYAQTDSDNVVINELDINPPGNDASSVSEWVELYNPTDSDIDIGDWEIASTTVLKKTMTIPTGTIIKPGQFLTYSYQTVWFTDSNESVELRDENGIVIDKTPALADTQNDFTSWQRIYDGYDMNSYDDWKFVISTAGSSNGKLIETQESKEITVTISSEKSFYLFGEVAVIQGSVSEEVYIYKPFFAQATINVNISGPNYYKTLTLYPDRDLNFATTLKLQQVLGANEGIYDVSVDYAGETANTSFSVGFEFIELEEKVDGSLSLITDKSLYLPGQTVLISGFAEDIIPFEGMKFTVTDSIGEVISTGNLFPTNGEFTTTVFLTTISPKYGTFEINAEYFGKSISTSFEVVEDIKEDVPISLWTDKVAYALGDTVTITGRLNNLWVNYLDLEILHTKNIALGVNDQLGGGSSFKILDIVRLDGDSKFQYSFTIPISDSRLGDYSIKVSKDVGSASTIIHVVSDPSEYVVSDEPLTIHSDKEIYELGDEMIITGFIKEPFSNSSYKTGSSVKISISHEDGTPLEIIGLSGASKRLSTGGIVVAYDFTAIPEISGSYSVRIPITQSIFPEGNYVVKSEYLDNTATKTFTIVDPLDLKDGAIISLDREIYGLGDVVYLSGILPPTNDGAVEISVTKPDGTVINSGAPIDNQRFSWSWNTPIAERYQNIKTDDGRDVIKSNFGIYKIRVATDTYSQDHFFKVSADPENDSLSTTPLFVTTDKSLYKAGDTLKVTGNVIKREQGDEGLVVPERVQIKVVDGSFPFKQ
ncbi:MAG: lamin tail domain-containing protein, partial [Nitrosopumilus sp.]